MIEKLKLKFGSSPNSQPVDIPLTPITVFVGPNNSGKSNVLREIYSYCATGKNGDKDVILDNMEFRPVLEHESKELLESILGLSLEKIRKGISFESITVHFRGGVQAHFQDSHVDHLLNAFTSPNSEVNRMNFCQIYVRKNILNLNGTQRIELVIDQPAGDLQDSPKNTLQVLFQVKEKRDEVRRIINEAFGSFLVIDPTRLGQLRIRLSSVQPPDEITECGIHPQAIEFHSKATPIEITSDGVKAFTGIITEVIAGDPKVLLIDEPEAFLHPALAFKLGQEISRSVSDADKRLFASTHSPSFLSGCISSGTPINIVRLTYRNGEATSRILPSQEVLEFMRNPLLRSAGLLSGLFYEFVVITESDTDRAFYQEINERLLRFKPEWAIPHCLFINAQNKQTIPTLLGPLRSLGIPAIGIIDIDVLKEGGGVWTKLMKSAGVPDIMGASLGIARGHIFDKFKASGKDMKKHGGLEILQPSDKNSASDLLHQLSDYGIFVIPNGELESWLKPLQVDGHGTGWLISMFEKLGENPNAEEYVKPDDNDVWRFIGQIRQWMTNSDRKGIPE